MNLHRAGRHDQSPGDFLVGQARHHQAQHLPLPLGETGVEAARVTGALLTLALEHMLAHGLAQNLREAALRGGQGQEFPRTGLEGLPAKIDSGIAGQHDHRQIDAQGADAGSALAQLPGVTQVSESERHGTSVGYEVASQQGVDIRRDLAQAVVSNGWGLLELRPMRVSLEEIFLSLTTEEQQAQAASEEPVHA